MFSTCKKKPPKSRHKSTLSLKNVEFKLLFTYLCLPHFSTKGNYESVVLNWKAWKTMHTVVTCRQRHGVPLQVVHTNPDHVCLRFRASLRLKAAQPQTNTVPSHLREPGHLALLSTRRPTLSSGEARGTHLNIKQAFKAEPHSYTVPMSVSIPFATHVNYASSSVWEICITFIFYFL